MNLGASWEPLDLSPGTECERNVDELQIRACHRSGSLMIRCSYPDQLAQPWTGSVIDERNRVTIMPQLPDLVVQAALPEKLLLLPREVRRFWLDLPAWLSITATDNHVALFGGPTRRLKTTWFGELHEGSLEYWVQTVPLADRTVLHADTAVRVPVKVHFEGKQLATLERLRLPFPNMTLFEHDGQLWTDRVNVLLREDQEDIVSVSGRTPRDLPGATLIASPRVVHRRGALPLLQRSL